MKLNFQTVLIGIFVVFAIAGFVVFAKQRGNVSGGGSAGTVVIWGTAPSSLVESQISYFIGQNGEDLKIRYVEKSPSRMDADLLNALAIGEGPDLFMLSQEQVLQHRKKVFPIPYDYLSEKTFQERYIDQARLFLLPEGVIAIPFMMDPMVMYFNRDLLTSSFVSDPPVYWDEFLTFVPRLTSQTESGEILASAVALGTQNNIDHFKDIVNLIMLQSGNPLVSFDPEGEPVSRLTMSSSGTGGSIISSTLRFYTDFADPAKETYSWNTSLRKSRDAFIAGELALYFGYASEVQDIRRAAPYLNFEVTLVPQTRNTTKLTIGDIYGFAISRSSANIANAFFVAESFASAPYAENLSKKALLPPVSRASYASRPEEPFLSLFYDSAIIARGWLDPDPVATDQIYSDLIRNVNSGAVNSFENLKQADSAMKFLINNL